jgi:hypothetical protein
MATMIYLIIVVLGYKILMPFIAWIVPPQRMESAANYIERTERRFPTKELFSWFTEWKNKKQNKK